MKTKLPLLALLAAVMMVGCDKQAETGGQAAAGDAVAYVNDEPISKQSFQFHLERRTQGQPDMASPEDREALLNELVEMTLLAQAARQDKLDQDPKVAASLENVRTAILAQAAVEQMTKTPPDEAALKAEYDERFGGEQQKEYHARHVLVETKEKAEQIIQKLDKGGDFVKLAEAESTGPTGPNGGDLGWFQPEQMVPPFAEALKALTPGSYTKEPVQTQFGWHVIKLEETRAATPPALDDVRPQLAQAVAQKRIETRLADLREKAQIRFEDGKAVVPPAMTSEPQTEAAEPEAETGEAAAPQSEPAAK